jgi:ABC-type bacteriocin/lantibiotic exporter with double-glycine peptidase domain
MDELNKIDKDFINGVWKKVRVLEYEKREQDFIKENRKLQLKETVRLVLIISIPMLFIFIPLLILTKLALFPLILTGIYLLSASIFYEYLQTSSNLRRIINENRDKKLI